MVSALRPFVSPAFCRTPHLHAQQQDLPLPSVLVYSQGASMEASCTRTTFLLEPLFFAFGLLEVSDRAIRLDFVR